MVMKKLPKITDRQRYFNVALRAAMREQGITQTALADKVGTSQSHIQNIIHTPNQWGSEELRMLIVHALGVGVTYEKFLEIGSELINEQEGNEDAPSYNSPKLPKLTKKNIKKFMSAAEKIAEQQMLLSELEERLQCVLEEATFDDAKELKPVIDEIYQKIQARRNDI